MRFLYGALALLLALGLSLGAVACSSTDEADHSDDPEHTEEPSVYQHEFAILGVECSTNCVAAAKAALEELEGVLSADVTFDVEQSHAVVITDREISREALSEAMANVPDRSFTLVFPEVEEIEETEEEETDEEEADDEQADDETEDEESEANDYGYGEE